MSRDLNETLIFAKVVELGSFTAAGRMLGIPKATVSRKVQALEARLDVRLMKRSTRRIGLTEAGALYYEHARQIAQELDQAESAVQQLQGGPRGWLRFTAPYSLGQQAIAPLLPAFRAQHPEVRVEMMLSNEVEDLIGAEFDLALRAGQLPPDSRLVARTLLWLRSAVFASTAYLERFGEPAAPAELAQHRALCASWNRQGNRYAWLLKRGDDTVEVPLQPVLVVNDPVALLPAVRAGEGLALLIEAVAEAGQGRRGLRRVLEGWHAPEVPINAVFPPGRVVPPKVRAFIDFLLANLSL
jgi:LysR family transcriptional regulator for bpeEF and oprC